MSFDVFRLYFKLLQDIPFLRTLGVVGEISEGWGDVLGWGFREEGGPRVDPTQNTGNQEIKRNSKIMGSL